MRIFVKAKPNAKEEAVWKIDENNYIVSVKEPPVAGRANDAIIRVLARHFETTSSRVRIISGHASKQKIIEFF